MIIYDDYDDDDDDYDVFDGGIVAQLFFVRATGTTLSCSLDLTSTTDSQRLIGGTETIHTTSY